MILGGKTKHCRWCGSAFTGTAKNYVFCSRTCEKEADEAYGGIIPEGGKPGKLLQPEVRICRRCGAPFVTNHEGRRYCSDRCRFNQNNGTV